MGQTLKIENFRENFVTIYEFCKAACHNDSDHYVWKNMGFLYWASNTASLLHRIYIAKTIKFVTIVDNIHISAVEHLNENTAIIGKRHFLMKEHRMKSQPLTKEAVPAQIWWCKDNGYHTILLTYNENHEHLVHIHRRWIAGKSIPGYEIGNSILKDFTEYPEKVEINGQKQYVFYYQFDKRRKLDFTRA
jgi:hypothetical protein